jgi:hypothetical protein
MLFAFSIEEMVIFTDSNENESIIFTSEVTDSLNSKR